MEALLTYVGYNSGSCAWVLLIFPFVIKSITGADLGDQISVSSCYPDFTAPTEQYVCGSLICEDYLG